MRTKLTVSIDPSAVANAKKYSRKAGVSLSQLVENYFNSLSEPFTRRKLDDLVGMLGAAPKNFDYKKEIMAILEEEYNIR